MKLRLMVLLMAAVVSFSGCSSSKGDAAEDKPVKIMVSHDNYYFEEAGLAKVSYNVLRLEDDSAKKFPQLDEMLKGIAEECHTEEKESFEHMIQYAKEDIAENGGEFFHGYESEREYFVQRADDRILSIRIDVYEYMGGVHGNYGSSGCNYDPYTAEELMIDDVVRDISVLPEMITEIITDRYADELNPFDRLQEYIEGFAPEDYNWTMDNNGITFYFVPYEIASYAMGQLTATITFDEHPELFYEKYMAVAE